MTVHDAIDEVQKVGTIRAENGKLKLRFPEPERARLKSVIETLRQNRETALQTLSGVESDPVIVPPAARWPQSLSELAAEVGHRSGNPESARREVWLNWCQWKAAALNRLFKEQGVTGQPGRITAATVEDVRKDEVERDALPVLRNARREYFCQGIVKGLTQKQAAVNAGFSAKTAESAGSRLAKNVKVRARIAELRDLIVKLGDGAVTEAEIEAQGESRVFIATRVRERQYRLTICQATIDRLRALIDQRAAAYRDIVPGGASGLLVRNVRMMGKGKNAKRIVEYTFDRALVSAMLECLKQAAIESGDWKKRGI